MFWKSKRLYGVTTFVFLLAAIHSNAFELWPGKVIGYETVPPELQKVREFIQKKSVCALAITALPSGADSKLPSSQLAPIWKTKMGCITDMTVDQGTMNEASGCAYAWYDSTRDSYHPVDSADTYGRGWYLMAKGKRCDQGGFEELLKMDVGYGKSSSVEQHILKPFPIMISRPVLIHATSKKYADWFEQHKGSADSKAKHGKE